MKKALATILTGISLAFGNLSQAENLPTEIELRDNRYSQRELVNLEVRNMAGTKVLDNSQTQQVYLKGKYTSFGSVTISYSTHPFEQQATRPAQGFASNSKIYVGLPEGAKIEILSQRAETIGNFDRVKEEELKPLEQTRYAKTFLKMGNNGMESLRQYDPLQKISTSLNDSIFLLTGTDLNLEDRISIYGGLKLFSDSIEKREKERGESTFSGELELQEIPLFPHDGIVQPAETKREIKFRILPGDYLREKVPFTVYQKLVLGREPTEGIGKLEAFFNGEIENSGELENTNEQKSSTQEEWIGFVNKLNLENPEEVIFINQKKKIAKITGKIEKYEVIIEGDKKYTIVGQMDRNPEKKELIVIEKSGDRWNDSNNINNSGGMRLKKITTLSELLNEIMNNIEKFGYIYKKEN